VRSAFSYRLGIRLILAVLLPALTGCGSATERTLEEVFEQVYAIGPTANVTVTDDDGAVFVYGSNINEMRVEAIKKAYTRERLKQIAVNVSVQEGSVSVETSIPKKQKWGFSDRSGTVDYTIILPATANLSRLQLGDGEVVVDGMRGEAVRARLRNGRVFAHNCFSNVEFTLDRGTLTLAYEWWETRKFSIQANITRGNAWALLPSDAAFHLIAETGDGKIENDFEKSAERGTEEITKTDTSIHGGGQAALRIHATEGNIKIVEANP
jgi:Putative adhesin